MQIPKRGYKKLTPEKAYLLGVLCGDGYLNLNVATVRLGSVKDIEFINYFKKQIEKQYEMTTCTYQRKDGYFDFFANSVLVHRDLIRYDQTKEGFRTKTWRIPNVIMNSKKESIKLAFLKGFVDSESSFTPSFSECDGVIISSSNKEGLEQIQRLFEQIEIPSYLRYDGVYRLRISSKQYLSKFLDKVGFRMKHKELALLKSLEKIKRPSYRNGVYEKAMELREKYGLSAVKIAKILNINEGAIRGWIFEGRNPYSKRGPSYSL